MTDVGYTRIQREWRDWLAGQLDVPLVQVESEALIPVRVVSGKQEYAARTIRPKIHRLWHDYLVPLESHDLKQQARDWQTGEDISDPARLLKTLPIDHSVPPATRKAERTPRTTCWRTSSPASSTPTTPAATTPPWTAAAA
ncbi:hypothetical protein [Deinococcus aquaticus]|uniref:hypothetical protein n=1 Tax=Deinococcus aquaticus TaxID=328692 RepID=UPI003622AC1C